MRVPNDCGVYEPSETFCLPNPRAGWRGLNLADIDLVELPDGWRAAIGAAMNCHGFAEPLTAKGQPFPSRDAAIADAVRRLRERISGIDEPQVGAVARWLDTLIPDQPDLFSALTQRDAA